MYLNRSGEDNWNYAGQEVEPGVTGPEPNFAPDGGRRSGNTRLYPFESPDHSPDTTDLFLIEPPEGSRKADLGQRKAAIKKDRARIKY